MYFSAPTKAFTASPGAILYNAGYRIVHLNPFTLRTPLEPNVCFFHTFENNLRTKQKFTKYLKESCSLASDRLFSFKCFPENAFESNIFPNLSGLFWLL